jgi:hypothetical protein
VWSNNSQINEAIFLSLFKQRVIDEYLQEWTRDINDNRVLIVYKALQTTFAFEPYLETIVSRNLRSAITKFRICAHNLRIQTGRYDRVERNLRICQLCNSNEVEDEFHFLFKCAKFVQIRENYIKAYYRVRPNMFKLTQLLTTQNKSEMFKLGKFITEALKIRQLDTHIIV